MDILGSIIAILAVLANISQVVGTFWVLKYGSKTLTQVLKARSVTPQGKVVPKQYQVVALSIVFLVVLNACGIVFSAYAWSNIFSSKPSNTPQNTPPIQITSTSNPSDIIPTATPTYTPTPTPIPTKTPQVLTRPGDVCKVDWADKWTTTADWQASNGMLQSNVTSIPGKSNAISPCQLRTANYAIEASIRFVAGGYDTHYIGLVGREGDGYFAGFEIDNLRPNYIIIAGGNYNVLAHKEYRLDNAWHIYRFELNGSRLTFSLDGIKLLEVVDSQFTKPDDVEIISNYAKITVRSSR